MKAGAESERSPPEDLPGHDGVRPLAPDGPDARAGVGLPMDITPDAPPPFMPPSRQKALEWLAVLGAAGIEAVPVRGDDGWQIFVGSIDRMRAGEQIEAYEAECRYWPPPLELPGYDYPPSLLSLTVGVTLVWAFWVQSTAADGPMWMSRGAADAGRILAGEWWRAITALCLHADFGHAFGNAACCVIFGSVLSRNLGAGVTWLLILACGAAGNLGTAAVHGRGHRAIGASTAVFGALGLLGALRIHRHLQRRDFRFAGVWLPLLAVLALLALLGSGAGTDLLGHLFGTVAGLVIGVFLRPLRLHRQGLLVQWLAAVAAAAVLALSWYCVLR